MSSSILKLTNANSTKSTSGNVSKKKQRKIEYGIRIE